MNILYRMLISFYLQMHMLVYYINDTSMQRPFIHPYAYSILILLFTTITATAVFILLLLLLYYCHCYKTVATDKLLRASFFPGAADLTNQPSKIIFIPWLPFCRINKFGLYYPRRLL